MKALEWVPLSSIRPYGRNPRRHSETQIRLLAQSLKQYGWIRPLVVWRATGEVLVGNGIYAAAQSLGLETAPVVWFDGDEAQARALVIADNRLGELSWWDAPVLYEITDEAVLSALREASVVDTRFLRSLEMEWLRRASPPERGSGGDTPSGSDEPPKPKETASRKSDATVIVVRLGESDLAVLKRLGEHFGLPVGEALVHRCIHYLAETVLDLGNDAQDR
jgi:hypothetical protein